MRRNSCANKDVPTFLQKLKFTKEQLMQFRRVGIRLNNIMKILDIFFYNIQIKYKYLAVIIFEKLLKCRSTVRKTYY